MGRGSLIYLLVLGPVLRLSGASAELGARIAERFRSVVTVSIGTLVVTGVFLVADRLAVQNAGVAYWLVLALKIAVSLALFGVAAYQAQEARRSPKHRGSFYRVAPRWILALGHHGVRAGHDADRALRGTTLEEGCVTMERSEAVAQDTPQEPASPRRPGSRRMRWSFLVAGIAIGGAILYLVIANTGASARYYMTVAELRACAAAARRMCGWRARW